MTVLTDSQALAVYFALTIPLTVLGVVYPWVNVLFIALTCRSSTRNVQSFEVIKFILVILGLFVYHFYSSLSLSLLKMNILVAVLQDIINNSWLNSLLGLSLSLTATVTPRALWLTLYCLWNSVFSIRYGYSASTRLTLITGLIAHSLTSVPWVACRCVSLLVNMALRSNQVTSVFSPGETWITI